MIFPPKIKHSASGFTLLEIMMVMFIFALIAGGTIATLSLNASERLLRNASSDIELLAKKARTAAILHQKPYVIEFRENSLYVRPLAEAAENELFTALGRDIGGTAVEDPNEKTLREELRLDSDLTLSLRHWNTSEFILPRKNLTPIWRFDPNGLTEPISIRLVRGEDYALDSYHPLSATIADSELHIR